MKVLFVSSLTSNYTDENSSYMHRLIILKKELEKLGVCTNIIYIGDYIFGRPSLLSPLSLPFILRSMRNYDIIHGGGTGGAYLAAIAKVLFRLNSKIIYDVHGNTIEENRLNVKGPFYIKSNYMVIQAKIMEYLATKYSDYFVVCSDPLVEYYKCKGIPPDKIEVIPNCVDIDLFKPKIQKNKNDLYNFVVTYAGGFHKYQGIENLIHAAELLKGEDIIFKIIGFKENDKYLKKYIKNRLGEKCELIDRVSRVDLINYLGDSDILIIPRLSHPSLDFSFATKFVEYASMGKPIIITRVSQVAKLVEEYNCGIVCDPNAKSLANAIMYAKNLPASKLDLMGSNARTLAVTRYSKDYVGKKYLNFLYKIFKQCQHG